MADAFSDDDDNVVGGIPPAVHVNVNAGDPVVKVSLSAVYAEVLKQNEANARIEGKVDRLVDKVMDVVIPQMSDHEVRIRDLEKHPSQNVNPDMFEALANRVATIESNMFTKKGLYAGMGLICTLILSATAVISLILR